MSEFESIITNVAFKDLFNNSQGLRKDFYAISPLSEFNKLNNNDLTRTLASMLQEKDSNRLAVYGLEIKSNGSSRSNRIPLVRVSGKKSSIWKIASRIEDLEKTTTTLDNLYYFLRTHNKVGYLLPIKVIVLRADESSYLDRSSTNYLFVKELVKKTGVILFSLRFLANLFAKNEHIAFDQYLNSSGNMYTVNLDIL